ncbi:hypothetical protein GCM10022251_26450 [Phytohabitans flavus]|uniref:Uncharacterized protein n=1 Tax=Phytohabitans flavus TaxID=1076124 RepID=A0A6F8XPR6_9ACTN|nr:hypothetical protein [Phytohabitans flavus]BCB75758.1 hypothetical protein Pflav_021680 [Phytohabitans flavus]
MREVLRQAWQAVRPLTAQQRFLARCGALLVASGAVHAVVAIVDWSTWWGPVTWRKPVVFALSFGVLAWSAVWVLRQLPASRFGWLPAGLVGGGAVAEVGMITTQRWRGQPSHFNPNPGVDSAIWSAMAQVVLLVALGVGLLLIWSLLRFEGPPAARVAVLVGLVGIQVTGYIGFDMAATGEAVVVATGDVPESVRFGAEGSAKLAHALGLHGLQVLAALAIGLGLRPPAARTQVGLMVLASAGYAAVFASVAFTAYAGRPWTSPTAAMALLALAGLATLLAVSGVVARWLLPVVGRRPAVVMR